MPDNSQDATDVRRVLEMATAMRSGLTRWPSGDEVLSLSDVAGMLEAAMTILVASIRMLAGQDDQREDELWREIALRFAIELEDE